MRPRPSSATFQSPVFLSGLDPDSLVYRGLVMTGRAGALAEVMDRIHRLGDRIVDDTADDQVLQTLVLNWSELLTWIEQAGIEASDELRLMQTELARE